MIIIITFSGQPNIYHWVKVFNMDANHPFSIICKFILNAFHGLSRYFEYSKGLEESKTSPHLKQPKLSLTNVPTGTDIVGDHMSSMRTKTHVADIVGDYVFCEKIADKKVNLSCRLLCSLHCCLQGKPLSFMWIFSIFHITIRAEMVPKKIAKISLLL